MKVTGFVSATKRIKGQKAFTLAEALVTILILLMVTSVVVAGIPAARRAYENVVHVSNAEVLLSTTMSALRNELCTASNVEITGDEKGVIYYSQTYGTESKIDLLETATEDDPEGSIMYQKYAQISSDDASGDAFGLPENMASGDMIRLISKETSGKDLLVTYDSISWKDTTHKVIQFNNLHVKYGDQTIAPQRREANTYSIRLISNSNE